MTEWTTANIPSQQGKLAIVTGANSGIGWHTALELARAGSEVILTARSDDKGSGAVQEIKRQLPQAAVSYELMDLTSLRSIRAFAKRMESYSKLDLLVNNAGIMAVPERRQTEDGFELQLGTNHIGHFALTGLLMPLLLRAPEARVTTVSSGAANMGMRKINFHDLQLERSYSPWKAYCQSKLANLLFVRELAHRYGQPGSNLISNAAHPGFARTNLQTTGPGKPRGLLATLITPYMSHDAAHGALPTLRAATCSDTASGAYYGPDQFFGLKGKPVPIAMPQIAQSNAAASRLWEATEQLCGVEWPQLEPVAK